MLRSRRSSGRAARRPGTVVAAALALGLVAAACATESASPVLERAEPNAPRSGTAERPEPPETTTTTTEDHPAEVEEPPVDIHALAPPAPADDPSGLAAQIIEAQAVLADEGATEVAVAAAALAQQVAYRRLGDRPEWDAEVLAALPDELRTPATRHAMARREFTSMHSRLSETLPAWEIIPPAPADELMAHYHAAQEEFGVRWEHLASINLVETGMGRIRGYSVAGARGPMQFMPATWDAFGEGDIDDPGDAIRAAARYLAHSGYADDLDAALFAYNRSNAYVRGIKLYADLMIDDPRAFVGLYHWGVLYRTHLGDVHLPVGYAEPERIPAEQYLARGARSS